MVRELRGGFVLRPAAITLVLGALAVALAHLEAWLTPLPGWGAFLDRLFPPEPEAAYIVLGTIAGSMMTIIAVIYSVILLVLTFASSQFSPRILVTFVDDRVSQRTLGTFAGTFLYCLLTLPAVRHGPNPFVPSFGVTFAMLLAVLCLACLLYFVHHIAMAIQASRVVDRIARETERVIDQLFPNPRSGPAPEVLSRSAPIGGTPVLAEVSGYIQAIDERRLLAAAQAHGVRIEVVRAIGHFAPEGLPLLVVAADDGLADPLRAACLRAIEIGAVRTMAQDVEFGFLQIVDIALKAISPAVNDPTTATTCIDHLSRLLLRVAGREPPADTLRDPDGCARLVLPRTSFPRLLDVAFSQIRHYGRADVAVPLRLMRDLADLAALTPHGAYNDAVRAQARLVAAACEQGFPEELRPELLDRLAAVERVAAPPHAGASSS